jgi:hypothetical protein
MQNYLNFPILSTERLITRICASVVLLFAVVGNLSAADSKTELPVLVEAEGFADIGGWVVDPQFMDLINPLITP